MRNLFLKLIVILILPTSVFAYPDFIGNGYTSCMTCHYNGAGNGALNDYGRGLYATEIAGKPFWNASASDEKLGESSGFLGTTPIPWWVRPAFKYRTLFVSSDPALPNQQTKRYMMQHDFDFAFLGDPDQKLILVFNLGFVQKKEYAYPSKTLDKDRLITREYYVRYQISEPIWIYLGFLDKTYGIRQPDHTSVNRSGINLGQNDQSHGAVLQYAYEKHEAFFNPYVGNLFVEKENQFNGAAFTYEYEPAEKNRVGFSLLSESSVNLKRTRAALLGKMGIGNGNAILVELGTKTDQALAQAAVTGAYSFAQATMRMARGFNLQSVGQYTKRSFATNSDEELRWGIGILYFPFQRLELRAQAVNSRTLSKTTVSPDVWSIQSQLHLSL